MGKNNLNPIWFWFDQLEVDRGGNTPTFSPFSCVAAVRSKFADCC